MENIINIQGQALSGRYLIVQMDNGEGVSLNLREVMAFGMNGKSPTASHALMYKAVPHADNSECLKKIKRLKTSKCIKDR